MAASPLIELFQKFQPLVEATGDYELQSQLAQLRDTYSSMLRFMVQGMDDPNASRIYADLVCQTYVLGDRAERLRRLRQQGSDKYSLAYDVTLRQGQRFQSIVAKLEGHDEALQLLRENAGERESLERHHQEVHQQGREEALLALFNWVWTSDAWSKSDGETALAFLENPTVFVGDKCLLLSAVLLALQEMFDQRKLMLLFDAYLIPDPDISQRALVALVLTIRTHDERLAVFPQVQSRLSLLFDDPHFISDTFRVFMQLQYSRLTDSVSEKMRSDIIPTIIKGKQFKQTKFGLQEIDDYMTQNGENPEWLRNRADNERAQEKLHEMAELQMDGADIYMSTFSQMKSNNFFQAIPHWFYVFSLDHPVVASIFKKVEKETAVLFKSMLRYAPFCESDRFSFTFMLDMFGTKEQGMLANNLTANLSHDEMSDMLEEHTVKKRAADVSRNYIFDLYRFFTLYPFHLQFHNPFAADQPAFTPLTTSAFEPLLQHRDEVLTLADFFMRKGIYQEAIDLFELLLPEMREEDADLWQKIGFCQQKQGRLNEAFECYKKAYDLAPSSQWTLKHLATVAFQGEWYAEAEAYYSLLLDDDPDNLRYLRRKVGCLMKQNLFEDAITVLYKVLYLEEDSVEDQNNMAWCQLQTGQIDKARERYQNVFSTHVDQPSAHFNLACTYLAEGDMRQAYPLFRQAYLMQSSTDEGTECFVREYREAFDTLQPVSQISAERGQSLLDAIRLGI